MSMVTKHLTTEILFLLKDERHTRSNSSHSPPVRAMSREYKGPSGAAVSVGLGNLPRLGREGEGVEGVWLESKENIAPRFYDISDDANDVVPSTSWKPCVEVIKTIRIPEVQEVEEMKEEMSKLFVRVKELEDALAVTRAVIQEFAPTVRAGRTCRQTHAPFTCVPCALCRDLRGVWEAIHDQHDRHVELRDRVDNVEVSCSEWTSYSCTVDSSTEGVIHHGYAA